MSSRNEPTQTNNQITSLKEGVLGLKIHDGIYQADKVYPHSASISSSEEERNSHGNLYTERQLNQHSREHGRNLSQTSVLSELTRDVLEKFRKNGHTPQPSNISTERCSMDLKSSVSSVKKSLIDPTLEARVNEITAKILKRKGISSAEGEKDSTRVSQIISQYDPITSAFSTSIRLEASMPETGAVEDVDVVESRDILLHKKLQKINLNFSAGNKLSQRSTLESKINEDSNFPEAWNSNKPENEKKGAAIGNITELTSKANPAKVQKGFRERFCCKKRPTNNK